MMIISIIFILIVIAMLAFSFKVYLQDSLEGKRAPFLLLGIFRRIFGIKYILPIDKKKYKPTFHQTITKANISIAVFWICFIIILIAGVFYF